MRFVFPPRESLRDQIASMASKLVLVFVLVFDLIAFSLAVAAEQRRSTARILPDPEVRYNYCVYDSKIATGLGAGALLFLLLSQVILMVVSKCFFCGRRLSYGGPRACALLLFLFSWLTFLIAEACLLAGSIQNARHTRYRSMFFNGIPSCETLRMGVFSAGAAFVIATAILSEFYYISISEAGSDSGEPEVGMTTYK